MFPIHRVDRRFADAMEPLGSKRKFWFRDGERRLLFKAEDRDTGEDWAEVIACHLCGQLGLPHAHYELAEEYEWGKYIGRGVVCETIAPPPRTLVLGNQLLLARDPQYPTGQRFKVKQHTVEAVCEIITLFNPPSAEWMQGAPVGVQSALDVFVGYILLDAWVANQDRHHENWGALWDGQVLQLAPTFDHGAALGRNISDKQRRERLTTRDKNRTVAAFSQRAHSAFYADADAQKPLGTFAASEQFAHRASAASKAWLDRLSGITESMLKNMLDQIPNERMTSVSKEFTLTLLQVNQQRLLERDGSI